ncbi:MAG TPA: UbiA family prenyltransferase [Gemmataceae bacterium]|nr:UbiA family prenyltransferase [Gemmataceae bacterium]
MTPAESRALAWARLVRLPNVFTALADIGLGILVAGPVMVGAAPSTLLLIASACLYCGGMVWNDYFDVEQDRRERPFRPIPAGEISPPEAARLGTGLLAIGWLCAAVAGWLAGPPTVVPALIAALLVCSIFLYDAWLKRTRFGPLGMGTCRFLNVLLGLSAVSADVVPWGVRVHLAGVVGVYIVGVTLFASTEARESKTATLQTAAGVMAVALALAVFWPLQWPDGTASPLFVYLVVVFGFVVGLPTIRACERPTPTLVQHAVKRAVLGLVALDALLATAAAGVAGLILLLLLPPAIALGRRVYST